MSGVPERPRPKRVLDARTAHVDAVLEAALETIGAGGTLIFPTDTVYGIGADPRRPSAVERVFVAKSRPRDKPLSLHFASVEEALEYAPGNAAARRVAEAFMPGPITMLVARPPYIDPVVTGGIASIGLRVPAQPLCRAILEVCGPLAATSANVSGAPAFMGEDTGGSLPAADLLVLDGPTPLRGESTILDVSESEIRVIREGVLSLAQIEAQLGLRVHRLRDARRT